MAKPADLRPLSHRTVLSQHHKAYEQGVENGEFIPFTYPMATYGAALLLFYFLFPPWSRWHSRLGRYFVFGLIAAWHVFLIRNCRSHSMVVGFGIGIVSAWGILWSAVVLIFCDAKADFQRVKRIGNPGSDLKDLVDDSGCIHVGREYTRPLCQSETSPASPLVEEKQTVDVRCWQQPRYYWQSYPALSLKERLEWTFDLLTNFRGIGWNWSIAGIPSRPLEVEKTLSGSGNNRVPPKDILISRRGIKRLDDYWLLVLHNFWLYTKSYMALDALKVLINHDPYFWGQIDCSPPAHLPLFIQGSPFLLHGYRQAVSMSMIWLGLRSIFCFGPLIFAGLLGPRYLGSNGEPWMYMDHYGNYSNVLNRGLAGWWGGWWHQTFRYAFETSGEWVTKRLGIDRRSPNAKILKLFVAFSVSGTLHACGSITTLGHTAPWSKSFMFFFLQPFGVLAEMAWRKWLRNIGLLDLVPTWIGQASNFLYVHCWFAMTAQLISDDFARGGLWLMEPVMFSPLRGLGFGSEGDGFFCWGGKLVGLHTGRRWLLNGITL